MTTRTCRKSATTPSGCEHYSYTLSRCRLGKINPPTFKGAKSAETVMGPGYVCGFSKWRQKLNDYWNKELTRREEGRE
jgi:hypothetical protein